MMSTIRGKPWGRMAACAGLFAWGCWGLANTAVMSYASGAHSADSALGQWVQPSSALTVDVGVAVLAAVTFALLARGSVSAFLSGVLMCIPLLAFGLMSVKNTLAFGMIERVEKAERITQNTNAKVDAVATDNKNALGIQERHLSWLRAEYSRLKDPKEKAALRAEIREATKPAKTEVATKDVVMADPEAAVLGKRWEMQSEDFVYYNQLGMALLLIAAKVFGFGFASAYWPRKDAPAAIAVPASIPEQIVPEAQAVVAEKILAPEVPAAIVQASLPAIESVPVEVDTVKMAPAANDELEFDLGETFDIEALQSPERRPVESVSDLENSRRARAVKAFITTQTVPVTHVENTTTADEAFQLYTAWAANDERGASMTQKCFALLCNENRVQKVKRGGSMRYFFRSAREVPARMVA